MALLEEDEDLAQVPLVKENDDESDVLKKKLAEMEQQMAKLKEQLNVKNTTTANVVKDAQLDFSQPTPSTIREESGSLLHQGDTDSSEDEEGNRKTTSSYNEFGQFVKKRLAHPSAQVDRLKGNNVPDGWKKKHGALTNLSKPETQQKAIASDNSFIDPFFGIKILNPLIGSTALAQKMEGRKLIKVSQIRSHMRGGDIKVSSSFRGFSMLVLGCFFFVGSEILNTQHLLMLLLLHLQDDWVTLAVVVSKGEPRTSQKGQKYSIWKLSDLKDCSKLTAFFLFGQVFTTHWKMAVGSVIGLLNPNFLKDGQGAKNSDEVSFTVDNPQKILHVGSSKDLGWCKATRKDGSRCPSFVNKSECEFCIYHVQNEFKKASAKRSEIQSNFSGTGISTSMHSSLTLCLSHIYRIVFSEDRLKQKVLGKQEVFYGGQLFSNKVVAPPASKVVSIRFYFVYIIF